ncbi:hypothetical protein CBF34_02405 [Vagococcus penaei]|uniref:Uncharacterized protein n=1 Tax=Vagococcus penaei TaxID=633807 RepID=A0A1Q2D8A3_9ENTE|nr:TIGR01906 family membrane protein [Vagococcus penaei]AQP54473.1 hypothetical protein BW732_09710 [Vagococcus penaei]RSU06392.1 hypothetical protein CBF34_02405 [Vagococcus penaei]
MSRWFQRLSVGCLLLSLITLSVALTINSKWLFSLDIRYLDIVDSVGLSKDTLMHNYNVLLDYLNYFWVKQLNLPDFSSSTSGLLHFWDVKKLFQFNYAILLITIFPSIFFLKKYYKSKTMWLLIKPLSWFLAILLSLIVLMIIAFDQFFVFFHEIFFTNDDWLFDPITDPIITMLPQEFFLHCFILFFILLIFMILGLILLGKYQLKELLKKS